MAVNFNLEFILRLTELILVIGAFVLFAMAHHSGIFHANVACATDILNISASIYLIIIAIVIILLIVKNKEVDSQLLGVTFFIGGLLLFGSGLTVAIFVNSYDKSWWISGIIGAIGGALLFVDGLKNLGAM